MPWRLTDAKNRFSELVNRALTEGPQLVLRRDDAVIVMDRRHYEKLTGKRPSFKEFLTGKGPYLEDVDVARDRSGMREVSCEGFAGHVYPIRATPQPSCANASSVQLRP